MVVVKSLSTEMPEEWDSKSSPTTVYHNINIKEIPSTEDSPLMYEYDQEQYTLAEYQVYIAERNHADISYLSMMMGINL